MNCFKKKKQKFLFEKKIYTKWRLLMKKVYNRITESEKKRAKVVTGNSHKKTVK